MIVVAGAQSPQAAPPPFGQGPYYVPNQTNSWEPQRGERRFKVVGEREEWIE